MGKRKQEEAHNSQKDNIIISYSLGNIVFQGFLFWKKISYFNVQNLI